MDRIAKLNALNTEHLQTVGLQRQRILDGQAKLADHNGIVCSYKDQLIDARIELERLLTNEILAGKGLCVCQGQRMTKLNS